MGEEPDQAWLLEELAPEDGFWARTPEFDVAPGEEVQDCYFFAVPDLAGGEDLWIDRTALGLQTGSHHLNVFRVRTIVDLDPAAGASVDLGGVRGTLIRGEDSIECWQAGNWADWPLVANSQRSFGEQVLDWQLPDGVAARFRPGELLMLQLHYVNTSDQPTPARARGGINFYRSRDGDTLELGALFATQTQIRVCRSSPRASFAGACRIEGAQFITAANGHFHSRGKQFRIWSWDGTDAPTLQAPFYENSDWSEPHMAVSLDITIPPGGGVWWQCDFEWREPSTGCAAVDAVDPLHANDCCYTFGPKVESREHCNTFVYYYPVASNVQCAPRETGN